LAVVGLSCPVSCFHRDALATLLFVTPLYPPPAPFDQEGGVGGGGEPFLGNVDKPISSRCHVSKTESFTITK